MYCKNCGRELSGDARFCPHCGTEQQNVGQKFFTENGTTVSNEEKPAKVWKVFSVIGKILGIVGIATAFIPYLNFATVEIAIIGIVMSCLGRKAQTEEADKNCSLGLKLSIAALVVSVVLIIVYVFLYSCILVGSMY